MTSMAIDTIFIHDIKVEAIIGIHDFEKISPQLLIINVDLGVDIKVAAATDDIAKTLDYAAISDFIIDYVASCQVGLLETLAEHLVAALFEHFGIQTIKLSIQKPGAIRHTQMVGLSIYRQRGA